MSTNGGIHIVFDDPGDLREVADSRQVLTVVVTARALDGQRARYALPLVPTGTTIEGEPTWRSATGWIVHVLGATQQHEDRPPAHGGKRIVGGGD